MKRSRILLADDHAVVIEGLRRMLGHLEFEVVGAVSDGRALLHAAARLQPDAIITDIAMPLLNGIDAAREIHKQSPRTKIIFLTMHSETVYATAALAAGASGFVLKSAAEEEMINAIREALAGRIYISKTIAKSVNRAREVRAAHDGSAVDGLTRRQREVLQFLAEGRQAKEIAVALNVSPKTVEFHKYRIMETLGVRTVVDLTRYALKRGIVA